MSSAAIVPEMKIPVTCNKCGTRQTVHVLGQLEISQVADQTVTCASCKKEFTVLLMHKIIAGPFIP